MYHKSRVGRREQISQQEKLIEQRKQEIENKLKQLESNQSNVSSDGDVKTDSGPSPLVGSVKREENSPLDALNASSSGGIVNKFANDGSFFEQFLKLQKPPLKDASELKSCENVESKADIKPIRMTVKEYVIE